MARQSPFMSSAQLPYPSGYQQRDVRYTGGSSVEPPMALNRRPSLLAGYHGHFGSPERTPIASYYPSLAPVSMGPHVDEHSKRSRYPTGGNLSANSQLLPLSIEVKKEQQVYQPQTEAISPTPDDPKNDSNIRDSTITRNAISKLESEIDLTMKKLHRAKLSQSEIRSQADRSAADEDNDDQDDLLRTNGSQTLIEKILHDNRKKAEDSQKVLNHLNNNMDLTIPLYQEPNDLEGLQRIRSQYLHIMKDRLKELFKKRHDLGQRQTKSESDRYDKNYQEWQRSIEKEEKVIASKDLSTYRETFEKTFPELRKTREDKEKKQASMTDSSSSEQPISLTANLVEQELELEEEKLRKSSIVPPIIYDSWQRKHQYFNQNGLIRRDAAEFYKERTQMPPWSLEEKQIFIEKFTQSPKNFGYISSFLENKTTEQCVQFYYMTKKTENYKNLLRKQTQATRRRAKQNATTTTTTLTSSTTIETTLVTKVTSSNTIVSSTAQQLLRPTTISRTDQDTERSTERAEKQIKSEVDVSSRSASEKTIHSSDESRDKLETMMQRASSEYVSITGNDERHETNPGDGNDEKRANKNRCQLLSCTTEKLGRKKNRKNRLRAFPNKWNELTKENREAIRRSLQIPPNVQRCCTRCYEKLIIQVRQRQTTSLANDGEEDDEDEEASKNPSIAADESNTKQDDEWTEHEIDAFTKALHKFGDNWAQIAEYVHRSEQSCRAFYQKHRKKNGLIEDEQNIDEDNVSISGSEDQLRRARQARRGNEQVDEDNEDDPQKTIINEDSNDSRHGMIIDEGDEQAPAPPEKTEKRPASFTPTDLTTISSLVEREISKTLNETEKHLTPNTHISPSKPQPPTTTTTINSNQPPPLVTLTKSHSPSIHSHPPQPFSGKGSIMRGTPISPSNKPISVDTSPNPSHMHPHHYSSPRNDYPSHSAHVKPSKIVDQQHLYTQNQAAYMRHYSHQQAAHGNFPPSSSSSSTSSQYLQPPHKSSPMSNQQTSANTNKSMGIDTSNTDTYETLRADFVTSRYLTTTNSPNHERQSRHPSEQRSPSHPSSSSTSNAQQLPPPTAILPTTSNPSIPSPSPHSHHTQQQQAAILAASQILASSGMHPQEILASGLLPYSHCYSSLPGASFYVDPRLMHEFATANNNEQLKNLRTNRHLPYGSTHSPPEPAAYLSGATKRHAHDSAEHMRYPGGDYSTSVWRSQNLNSTQQMHGHHKSTSGTNENPLLKANELSRHAPRITSAADRDARSPDEYHHRGNQSRASAENPSAHYQRVDLHTHHKSSPHEKLTPTGHYSEYAVDNSASSYSRLPANVHKPHASLHHPYTSTSANRPGIIPSSQISPHHGSAYKFHPSPAGTGSPHHQHHQQSPHPPQPRATRVNELPRSSKEPISIGDFMKQSVNEFVASTNNDNKSLNAELSTSENITSQSARLPLPVTIGGMRSVDTSDQPILIDADDDSDSVREHNDNNAEGSARFASNQDVNKSTMENEQPERRRDSSIKKILSNQPLEKPEYVEINQKVQNSTVGASKVHATSDNSGLERANSTGTRETTRSRGSITMRMLMGANGIYADGKAQPMTANEASNEQSNKRPGSPNDKSQSLEYLIRGELFRACPTIPKTDELTTIFQSRRLSPTAQQQQQRSASNQQPSSKRMRTSPRDDARSSHEQHHSPFHQSLESSASVRDPFALQPHSKTTHHQTNPSSTATAPAHDRTWQSYVQQQYQQSFGSRTSRPASANAGSITQGSPISPSTRLSTDQAQYPSAANNQLVHPRYSYHTNKSEQQFSPSRQTSTSPVSHSPMGKFARRAQQTLSSPADAQYESTLSTNVDPSSNPRSPPINPIQTNLSSNTPPIATSPVSSLASPTTSVSSNNAHSLKKRLISEYEHEQQQRHSPTTISPAVSASTPPPPSAASAKTESTEQPDANPNSAIPELSVESISDAESTKEFVIDRLEEAESST